MSFSLPPRRFTLPALALLVSSGVARAAAPVADDTGSPATRPQPQPQSPPPAQPAPPPDATPTIPIVDAEGSPESKRADSPSNPDVQATALPNIAGGAVHGYAKKGVWELGGSVSLLTGSTLTQAGIAPTVGYFFIDYVELSAIPQLDYAKTGSTPGTMRLVLLLEPSWHVQIHRELFLFFGAGIGGAYEKAAGLGLALAPRTGINLLIGGSGVLSVAFEYVYSASPHAPPDQKLAATEGLRAGYTIAW